MRGRARRSGGLNYWPGFVDALSSLLLVLIFLLMIFMIGQFYLGAALTSRNDALAQLQAEITALAQSLSLEQAKSEDLQTQLTQLSATLLRTEEELDKSKAEAAGLATALADADGKVAALTADLDSERALTEEANAQLAILNQQLSALREQLASLQQALEAAEAKDIEQRAEIANLSSRLNAALAQKVQELSQYRSRFFEQLQTALGDRSEFKVVGDRFVFESDILFAPCSDEINPSGRADLDKLADVLLEVSDDIPSELNWVLRVDGHADIQPLSRECQTKFASNWHLSAARAISVVQYLSNQGVPDRRLAAAGFGEYQPLGARTAFRQNRRIEFKLTER